MTRKQPTRLNKCYRPSNDLVNLMVRLHNLEVERTQLEKDIAANMFTRKQATEKRAILKDRKRALDTKKVRILDEVVFPSMANLTCFLELILSSPHTNRIFEKDLKALFLSKSETSENKDPIFARFIEACCWSKTSVAVSRRGRIKSHAPLSDSRLILMQIMMEKIWKMIPAIGEHKFKTYEFLNSVLYADFGRAVAWMIEFAHEPYGGLYFDKKRRPALF